MTIGSILLGIALAVLVALVLARPLLQASREEQVKLTRRQVLMAEKEAILAQIRDLDFDHDTGKMPDEIHERQRTQLMNSAADILRQLEALAGGADSVTAVTTPTVDGDVDADIEAAVSRMRQAKRTPKPRPAAASGGGFCPQCGNSFDAGDKFCVACGHKLRTKQAVR